MNQSTADHGIAAGIRRLTHIPVIHTAAEMGRLGPWIKEITIRKLGGKGWTRNVRLIDEIWTQIERAVKHWPLPYERMRLYQDGLPVCGHELQIVTDLARQGSRNHQLLLRLVERGALLMGTEAPELLVQEYRLIKQILDTDGSLATQRMAEQAKTQSAALLEQRDRAIAERINCTLQPGETSLLFLGMLHSVEAWLAYDIEITHPVFPALTDSRSGP